MPSVSDVAAHDFTGEWQAFSTVLALGLAACSMPVKILALGAAPNQHQDKCPSSLFISEAPSRSPWDSSEPVPVGF